MSKELTPTEVVRLLCALKGVYTFKELEGYLGISSQVLWRYTKYLNTPEKPTAKEIMLKIEKERLIQKALSRVIELNRYGYIEAWKINKNINLPNLFSYLICRRIKSEGINPIIPISIDAIPLATILSDWLKIPIYLAYPKAYLTMDRWRSVEYLRKGCDYMERIYLPRGIFKRNDKVLLLDLILSNSNIVDAVCSIIESEDAKPWGLSRLLLLEKNGLKK